MGRPRLGKVKTSLALPPHLMARLKRAAREEMTDTSSLIARILTRWLDRRDQGGR